MSKFLITYEVVTPESAEHGDTAENGYLMPGGWRQPVETVEMDRDREALEFNLRSAVNYLGCVEDAGSWFVEADGRDNYRDGSNTRYSLHPPKNITPSSYGRLARLLKA
jgi:hypothetical protein